MTVCVLSDTHGDLRPLKQLKNVIGSPDAVFHLGDTCRDAREAGRFFGCPVYAVKGNCDRGEDEETEKCFMLKGKRFYLLHGHTAGSMLSLFYKGRAAGADMVLSGHTHVRSLEYRDGIALLNPGSLSEPRCGSPAGLALLRWENDGEIDVSFIDIP